MAGTCTYCKEPCEVVIRDFGIGPYEYWGATGWDSQLEAVSNCCEAPAVDDAGYEITIRDLKEDQE